VKLADHAPEQGRRPASASAFTLLAEQRQELERIVGATDTSERIICRARIILLRAAGWSCAETAAEVGVNLPVVLTWERRFASFGLPGLRNAPGQGAKPGLAPDKVARILKLTAKPDLAPKGRWTVLAMSRRTGVPPSIVQRLWAVHGIRPHLAQHIPRSLRLTGAKNFFEVAGLYLYPPQRTLALCSDGRRFEGGPEIFGPEWKSFRHRGTDAGSPLFTQGFVRFCSAISYLDGKISGAVTPNNSSAAWLAYPTRDTNDPNQSRFSEPVPAICRRLVSRGFCPLLGS
jgi:transposase